MNSLIADLEKAVSGLAMVSESDYPFEAFSVPGGVIDDALIFKLADKPEGSHLEQTNIDHLFRNMIKTYPNSSSVEIERAERFKQLIVMLKDVLSDLQVYRVGVTQVDVFIIGYAQEGNIVGLKTRLIET